MSNSPPRCICSPEKPEESSKYEKDLLDQIEKLQVPSRPGYPVTTLQPIAPTQVDALLLTLTRDHVAKLVKNFNVEAIKQRDAGKDDVTLVVHQEDLPPTVGGRKAVFNELQKRLNESGWRFRTPYNLEGSSFTLDIVRNQ